MQDWGSLRCWRVISSWFHYSLVSPALIIQNSYLKLTLETTRRLNTSSCRIWCLKLESVNVYMRTNNAIISNNQSKDLIALWCLHVKSKALSPIYMQFPLFLLFAKNCGNFFYCHYSHTPLHSTNDGHRKSRCVTGRCFNLFTSNA